MAGKKYKGMQAMKKILQNFDLAQKKYISKEFQDYGYRLAIELDDLKHKSLYIKLAKEESRAFLEEAKIFVKEAYGVKNKGKLFMWKLKQIKNLKFKIKN